MPLRKLHPVNSKMRQTDSLVELNDLFAKDSIVIDNIRYGVYSGDGNYMLLDDKNNQYLVLREVDEKP